MFHFFCRFFELDPHNCFITNIRHGFTMLHREEQYLLSSDSVSDGGYLFSERYILYTSLFTKFPQCGICEWFSSLYLSLWEHIAPISVKDAEDLSFSFSLSYRYTTSTIIEPEKWCNFFLPDFECFLSFFDCFHGPHYRCFREKWKKFA